MRESDNLEKEIGFSSCSITPLRPDRKGALGGCEPYLSTEAILRTAAERRPSSLARRRRSDANTDRGHDPRRHAR